MFIRFDEIDRQLPQRRRGRIAELRLEVTRAAHAHTGAEADRRARQEVVGRSDADNFGA